MKGADPTKSIDLTTFPAENIRNFSIIAHIGTLQEFKKVTLILTYRRSWKKYIGGQVGCKFYLLGNFISLIVLNRLLELTNTISKSGSNKQVLDKLKVERERGITVKAQVKLKFGLMV